MSIFNLQKKSKDYGHKNINNLLKDKNKETDLAVIEPAGNINQILTTKNLDNIEINEKQLETKRQGKNSLMITDKALDNSDKVYNDKRLGVTGNIMPINLLSESFDQKHLEAYKKAEENKKDTMFWDKYVGVQLEEDKTVVGKNIENNQIENNPNRFKSLNNKDIKDIVTFDVDKMASSLKDADALLFHIYAKSFKENRDINEREQQMINKINEEKKEVLSQLNTPVYTPEDKIRIVKQNDDYVAYDGLGIEKWRTEDESEILRHYPDAAREY